MTDLRTSFLIDVVAALQGEGQRVVSLKGPDDPHGDPREWRLDQPMDRAHVEELFDLGPLAQWYVAPRGAWVLYDPVTEATLHGNGEPVGYDDVELPSDRSRRVRVGFLDTDAGRLGLLRAWPASEVSEEVAALRGERQRIVGPNHTRRIRFERVSAREACAGMEEVLLGVAAEELPAWFVEQCAPRRSAQEWSAWAEQAYVTVEDIGWRRSMAWWRAEQWLRAVVPEERLWWVAGAEVVDESALDLTILHHGRGTPLDSLDWLVHAVGGRWTESIELSDPPVLEVVPGSFPPQAGDDPDEALAGVARQLLGGEGPVRFASRARRSGCHWELEVEGVLDVARLDELADPPPWLRWGPGRDVVFVGNGWNLITGQAADPDPFPAPGHPRGRAAGRWWLRRPRHRA